MFNILDEGLGLLEVRDRHLPGPVVQLGDGVDPVLVLDAVDDAKVLREALLVVAVLAQRVVAALDEAVGQNDEIVYV